MSDTLIHLPLTHEAVEARSRARREPEWLLDARRRAFALSRQMALPGSTEERWRRTDVSDLDVWALAPLTLDGEGERPAALDEHLDLVEARGGLAAFRNGEAIAEELDGDLRRRGVILMSLARAVREHEDLVRAHLFSQVGAEDSLFRALGAAAWEAGTFLYVPRGVEVDLPLLTYTWLDQEQALAGSHTLIVADEQARVTLFEGFGSAARARRTVVASAVEVVLGAGSEVRYVGLQDWGRNVWEVGAVRARLDRDATLRHLAGGLGGGLVKVDVESRLEGRGASAEMLGFFFEDSTQHYDYHTLQEHLAPSTTSDLLYKFALRDEARSVFAGMIRVHPGGQKTNAFQSNRNMLLSDQAKSDSKPELEIMANDLRCTHGSATSRIEEEHLFYLMSRGLNRQHATRMIVEGFFAEVFDRVPLPRLRGRLEAAVAEKMGVEVLR